MQELLLEKKILFNELNQGNDKIDFGKIIKKELDFRNKREERGLWKDNDLLRFRNGLKFEERIQGEEVPQFEIIPGTIAGLSRLIEREPQRDTQGRFRYLLTSGLAVEVITGAMRYHHDIDLVLFDHRDDWWINFITDNVLPERYWAEMKFDPAYLEQTAWTTQFQLNGSGHEISTVHPAIILVQKLSNAWGRPPRERDIRDVIELVRFWQGSQKSDPNWDAVMETAIAVLPQEEQPRTRERFSQYCIPEPVSQRPLKNLLYF